MHKILIVAAGFLIVTGWIGEAWAHGPGGFRSGTRGYGYAKPSFHRPLYQQPRKSFARHYRPSRALRPYGYGQVPPHIRYPYQVPTSQRLPRIENGVLYSKPGPLQNRFFYGPLIRSHNHGLGVSPLRKSLAKKARKRTPRHLQPFHPQDPWFLYGKGDQLRRMGIIPQYP